MHANFCKVALVATLVSACTPTSEALKSDPETVKQEVTLNKNYQAAYRDLVTAATDCLASTGIASEQNVTSELYSELGLGEVTYWLSNFGTQNYYWKAEIRKTGSSSSVMHVWAAGSIIAETVANKVILWANGDRSCSLKNAK